MAQYQIKHICGHEQTHKLYGKSIDRDKRMAYLKTIKCDACYAQDRQAESAAAALANAGLVRLQGSEKQVAWAETIRANFAQSCKNMLLQSGISAELAERYITAWVNLVKDAKWWIDNRDNKNNVSQPVFIGQFSAQLTEIQKEIK